MVFVGAVVVVVVVVVGGLLMLLLGRVGGLLLWVVAVGLVGRLLGVGVVLGIGLLLLLLLLLVVMRYTSVFANLLVGLEWSENEPEVGSDASCRSNAGLGDVGYCTPAAMAPRAVVVVDRILSWCSLAVARVVAVVAGLGRSWHCMEEVGLGWLEDEGGSSALRRSNRLLPYLMMCSSNGDCVQRRGWMDYIQHLQRFRLE